MFAVMSRASNYLALSRGARTLMEFCTLIDALAARVAELPLDRFVNEVLDRTGYRQSIVEKGEEERERLENLEEFISGVIEYQNEAEQPNLTEFLEQTALVADVDRYDDSADAVVLMTIHSAKGLEFPQVFLPGFEDGLFPGLQTIMQGPAEMEEERRLAYVAITRAKDELFILHTKERMLYGRTGANPPSRFLKEIPEELLELPTIPTRSTESHAYNRTAGSFGTARAGAGFSDKISVAAPRPRVTQLEVLAAGDRVRHATFGEGTMLSVKRIGADYLYEVAFDEKGTKKLMATYAKLTKI